MYNLTTAERINRILKEKQIPKSQFYKDCGISSAAYSLWNQGKTNPSMKNLRTIATYLDVTVASLVEDAKTPVPQVAEQGNPDLERLNELLKDADPQKLQEIARYAEFLIGKE